MKFPGLNLRVLVRSLGVCAMAGGLFAQPPEHLTAREIFYGAATPQPDAKASKAPAAAPKPAAQKAQAAASASAAPKPPATVTAPSVAASSVASAAPAPPQQAPQQPAPQVQQQASKPVPVESSSGALKLVSYTRQPLGIRLSVVKVEQNGDRKEVAPDTNFQPGDRVRFSIQVAAKGYLYIINRGSSGTWTQLFPSPDLPNATNALEPGTTYSIPSERNFVVSNPPGSEKMFLILARQPVADIQSLILDMSRRGNAAPQAEPKAPPQRAPGMMADSRGPINDAAVDRLRSYYARDLIIETVDQQTPGTTKENAVYAVSTGDGDDTRVVLDAQIKHQ